MVILLFASHFGHEFYWSGSFRLLCRFVRFTSTSPLGLHISIVRYPDLNIYKEQFGMRAYLVDVWCSYCLMACLVKSQNALRID